MAMKEENQELLEKMHEMETQLHITNENIARLHEMDSQLHGAKETLAKYVHEKRYAIQFYLQFPLKMNV